VIQLHEKDQVLWPPHCVQKTSGAEILLDRKSFKAIVKKGMDPSFDSYSGFQDDGGKKTVLDEFLQRDGIRKLVVYGIATDYCVRATALDGVAAGYKVVLIRNLCRGVAPDTSQKAIEEMKARGIVILDDLDLEKIKAN
jgi:nicotinamidase/pyrazinamidase